MRILRVSPSELTALDGSTFAGVASGRQIPGSWYSWDVVPYFHPYTRFQVPCDFSFLPASTNPVDLGHGINYSLKKVAMKEALKGDLGILLRRCFGNNF